MHVSQVWSITDLFICPFQIALQPCMSVSGRLLTHVTRDGVGLVLHQGVEGVRRHGEQVAGVSRICPAGHKTKTNDKRNGLIEGVLNHKPSQRFVPTVTMSELPLSRRATERCLDQ